MTLLQKFLDDPYEFVENEDIEILIKLAKKASDKYYNGESIMSDAEFDLLIDAIREKNSSHPFLKTVGAPTMAKNKVELPFYMGSMNKIKVTDINDFNKWINEHQSPYYISDKLDGISAMLEIDKEKNITKLYTRGDGKIGTDITPLIKYLNLTKIINNIKGNYVVIRGELVMTKDKFKKYESIMANARNMVAGIVNSKKIIPERVKDIDFVTYEIITPWMSINDQYLALKANNFNVVQYQSIKTLSFDKLSKILNKRKQDSEYEIDGIIVSFATPKQRTTNCNPTYAFAFKETMEDQTAQVEVLDVEWNETKDGYLKPRLILNPTKLSGVIIKHVTAFNAKYIKDNKIGPGTIIKLVRSGDVIPHILDIVKPSKNPKFPDMDWEWTSSGVDIIVKKTSISGLISNLTFFVQKLKIKNVNEKIIQKFIENGIDTIIKIITIKHSDLEKLPGFKTKMVEKIYNNIQEAIDNMTMLDFMVASNYLGRGLGEKKLNKILSSYPNIITDYNNTNYYDLIIKLDGFDSITTKLFIDNLPKFIELFNTLPIKLQQRLLKTTHKKKVGMLFKDLKIVFSGFRNKDWEKIIEDEGGQISNSISNNTNILIAKYDDIQKGTNSKIIKAKELNILILTPEEFAKKYKLI